MPRRIWFLLLVCLFVFPVPGWSQSPEKPVPVRNEPHHHVTLENEYLRMIDVHLPVGESTLYHVHTVPSVVVEMSDSSITSQEWGAAPTAARHVAPGETRYAPYDEKALTHRVTNTGTSAFHVLDIELLRSAPGAAPVPAALPAGMKLEWEQKLVRVYEIAVAPGKSTEVAPSACARLLIAVSGNVQTAGNAGPAKVSQALKAGAYLFFAPGSRVQIDNRGQDAAQCVLLELK